MLHNVGLLGVGLRDLLCKHLVLLGLEKRHDGHARLALLLRHVPLLRVGAPNLIKAVDRRANNAAPNNQTRGAPWPRALDEVDLIVERKERGVRERSFGRLF